MRILFSLFVLGVTLAVFAPSLFGEFLDWDDRQNFLLNEAYRGLDPERLGWMFTTFYKGPYQPLSWVSLACDYLVFGMNPFGYHLTNVLLHALNALLFFLLASELLGRAFRDAPPARAPVPLMALAAAFLFALHPLRVESVAWITERRDVLSGFFYLAAILAYVGWATAEARRPLRYVASLVLFLFALLSKGLTMTLPITLLVLDAYPLGRTGRGWGRLVLEKVPFLVLAVAAGVAAIWGQAETSSFVDAELGLVDRALVTLHGAGFYVGRTLVPLGLSPLYELPVEPRSLLPIFLAHGALAAALVVASLVLRRRVPGLFAATVNYLALLLPVSGIVLIGKHLVADRYSYLMCMGWALLLGAGLVHVLRRPGAARALAPAAVVVVSLVLSALTVRQISFWRTDEALWGRVHALDPGSFYANVETARLLGEAGDHEAALVHLERALARKSDYESLNTYAVTLFGAGQSARAVAALNEAIAMRPARHEARMNLARYLARTGDPDGAAAQYRAVLDAQPGFAPAQRELARLRAGAPARPIEEALAAAGDDPQALFQLGRSYAEGGAFEEARRCFARVAELTPESADAWANLGGAHALLGQDAEAERCFDEALRLDPVHARARAALEELRAGG